MSEVRMTIIRPKSGQGEAALGILKEIDGLFRDESGLLLSFVFGPSSQNQGLVGRVSVWDTKNSANKVATSECVLALRARLQKIASDDIVETLAEVAETPDFAAAGSL